MEKSALSFFLHHQHGTILNGVIIFSLFIVDKSNTFVAESKAKEISDISLIVVSTFHMPDNYAFFFSPFLEFFFCQIGHVTKSGDIAGPRVLEHIVDVVLYMEVGIQFFSLNV